MAEVYEMKTFSETKAVSEDLDAIWRKQDEEYEESLRIDKMKVLKIIAIHRAMNSTPKKTKKKTITIHAVGEAWCDCFFPHCWLQDIMPYA